jgi:hypothetical protein
MPAMFLQKIARKKARKTKVNHEDSSILALVFHVVLFTGTDRTGL